jgi:hypothetical protein
MRKMTIGRGERDGVGDEPNMPCQESTSQVETRAETATIWKIFGPRTFAFSELVRREIRWANAVQSSPVVQSWGIPIPCEEERAGWGEVSGLNGQERPRESLLLMYLRSART